MTKPYKEIATKLELKAQRAAKMGPHWWPWLFEATDNGKVICTGAQCPYKTRGPQKGQPAYRRHDPASKKTVVV